MNFIRKLFGKKNKEVEITEEQYNEFYELKERAITRVLGEMYDLVGHAIIPFQIGGTVDMYYFNNAIDGTAFATMELIEYENKGPIPNKNGMYELLAFSKHKINKTVHEITKEDSNNKFDKIERRICGIFTSIGDYSYQAKLEPGQTCELPQDEGKENICLIFDEYKKDNAEFKINGRGYGLLVCIEIFRSEMEYAMEYGSAELFKRLIQQGHYPYSDLERDPVV